MYPLNLLPTFADRLLSCRPLLPPEQPKMPESSRSFALLRPKLSDVARLAGVGNATVSRVLNGGQNVRPETAHRIAEVIRELGYQPNRAARSLKGASSGIIGMIVPSISDMFFSRCAEAVEEIVRENGGMLIVTASHDSPRAVRECFHQLLQHHIDGLILVQSSQHEKTLLHELEAAQIPIVGIDRPLTGTRFASVLSDNCQGALAATEHLLGHGYRTVAHIEVNPNLYTMRERHKGYLHAMGTAGLDPIHHVIHDLSSARAVLEREFARASPPLAIFAGNNLTARYLLEAAIPLHLHMPRDLAMLSFDDFDLADALNPPMSVVQQPVDDLGRQAARLLFRQMEHPADHASSGPGATLTLPTQLVLRGSCGCTPPNA